jgi:acetylornithine deacetylase
MPKLPTEEEMLRELVGTPSVSSPDPAWDRSNRAVVERLAEWAESVGLRAEVRPLPGAPHKANLVARSGAGEDGLVLSGHTDTVPYDEASWSTDPFDLVERDGVFYGLGTADMKGFFVAALRAVARVGVGALRRPLLLLGTADEESGMDGMRALLAGAPRLGAHAIIGEPTELAPVRMHKGVMMERITAEGRAGHASDPSLGASALEGVVEVAAELLALRDELAARFRDEAFAVPSPTLNLGRVAGGDSPNRICAHCALDVDLRVLPGMDAAALHGEIAARVRAILDRRGLRGGVEPIAAPLPAFETPADALIARVTAELAGKPLAAALFGTEGPYLNAAGVPTIVLGPGSIRVAHQPDEHLRRDELAGAEDLYARLIERLCVSDEPALGAPGANTEA